MPIRGKEDSDGFSDEIRDFEEQEDCEIEEHRGGSNEEWAEVGGGIEEKRELWREVERNRGSEKSQIVIVMVEDYERMKIKKKGL